ncbi:protein hunchback [Venturia canescens]|uniref:protein hunchback n=1 Tax=Venturia canescens TaxID=32260 RepID=UPI001C9CB35D|nr:protein hunchback [Venturia canescens]
MRGNWEAAEALVLAPSQQHQLQQQQQNIMEDQRLPLHSPTTPAWGGGINDRIVKEEPVEDKNDDSGVSPGHYTSNSVSPRSRRSSSTANCSLSPGSATSQDSNAMQCGRFDYSPQSMYKNCDAAIAYGRLHTMDQVSTDNQTNEHQAMDVVSSSMKSVTEDSDAALDILQCPVCQFTTFNRLQFSEHLATHYAANCEMPKFGNSLLSPDDDHSQQAQSHYQQMDHSMNAMDEESRASPSQGDRSEQESEEADEPGLRVPRVNSQGKVKTFRCKQCNFVAITKLEFWEHSRGHIKAEKLLTCPKCPFVTEYKHHLEYHLRNHFGSKPFKCDKCSYSCVNKSMLNSHLKSHSNVYQYRCANCSYATKYCHSLKLHLRKYKHNPAMVLNADGSPNPLPIIDVYGTRRGPKQKPSGGSNNGKPNDESIGLGLQSSDQLPVQAQLSPISRNHVSLNPMNAIHAFGNNVNQGVMTFPYGQLFAGFPMATNHYPVSDESAEKHLENLKTNLFAEYAKMMANDKMSAAEYNQDFISSVPLTSVNNNGPKISEIPMSPSDSERSNGTTKNILSATTSRASPIVSSENHKFTPLDLSKPEGIASEHFSNIDESNGDDSEILGNNNNNRTSANSTNIQSDAPGPNSACSNVNSPKTSGTSRRKGRAVKLDRRVVEDETVEENDREIEKTESRETPSSKNANETANETANVTNSKEASPDRNLGGIGKSNEFTCQYCEIAFGNVVMYTVHMGYHGYKDPYTCNMCGHECDDKVSFFLHIARSKHS